MGTLITGGTIVTATDCFSGDLLLREGKVAAVGAKLEAADAEVIDAGGLLVMPGGVDVHTHLDMPLGQIRSSDDFATGTRAAALGGTTCIVDFANPTPGQPLREALDAWRARARGVRIVGETCPQYLFLDASI